MPRIKAQKRILARLPTSSTFPLRPQLRKMKQVSSFYWLKIACYVSSERAREGGIKHAGQPAAGYFGPRYFC